jgi:hypothetical protein
MMTAHGSLCCLLCILLVLCTGCTSLSIGNVTARQDGVLIEVANDGSPVEAGVLVHVYQVKDLAQEDLTDTGVAATLDSGVNTVLVPIRLDPGTYKIKVYVTVNNERQTATIKDIVV